jgi:PKD repeat protein
VYAAPGTYTVRLTVTDDDGAIGSTTKSVTIASPDPGGLLASDAFTRTVSSGWGVADTGGSWSACGSACSVGGGVGRFVVPAGQGVMSFLDSVNSLDTDVAVDFWVDRLASSSGSFVSLVARGATGQGYWGKVRVASTGALTLSLTRRSNWAETTLSTLAVPGITAAPGDRLRIRLQAVGSSPTALRAKVWRVGSTEPAAWQLTSSDSTSALQVPDGIGLYGYVSGGATNGPVTMSLDNLSARSTAAPAENQGPTAAFTSSASGLTLSVDASGSLDPDGSVASYAWSFGDGATGTGRTASHTFGAAGDYTVQLTVTDDEGATASVSRQVTVTTAATSLVNDTFDRVVTSGWGTAPVGGPWTTASGATRLSVTGGVALSRHTAKGNKNEANLAGVSSLRTDLRVSVSADAAGTGSGTYVYVAGRRVSATNRYDARLRWLSGNRWVAALTANLGSSTVTSLAAEVTVPGTFAPGTRLNLRLQVFGTAPTTVRVKAWAAGTTEPAAWLLERTNAHPALQAPGAIGMQTYLSTSSTTLPLTITFDDLTVQPVP